MHPKLNLTVFTLKKLLQVSFGLPLPTDTISGTTGPTKMVHLSKFAERSHTILKIFFQTNHVQIL